MSLGGFQLCSACVCGCVWGAAGVRLGGGGAGAGGARALQLGALSSLLLHAALLAMRLSALHSVMPIDWDALVRTTALLHYCTTALPFGEVGYTSGYTRLRRCVPERAVLPVDGGLAAGRRRAAAERRAAASRERAAPHQRPLLRSHCEFAPAGASLYFSALVDN